MTYPEAIRYLESFINYELIPRWPYQASLKLKPFREFLATIGNPQDSLRAIHVAGSKGKGSTCAFLTYILRQAGFKVGLYTSPHLKDFRERIRILRPGAASLRNPAIFEGLITPGQLIVLVEKLKAALERYRRIFPRGALSYFEVCTALAFLYFKEKRVDFAVLETGLGGRLDATNTVKALIAVITPISYEHTDKLGTTLGAIAREKAGIIKSGTCVVVSAPQRKAAAAVIRRVSVARGARLYEVGRDIIFKRSSGQKVTVQGIFQEYPGLRLPLIGEHQAANAATAIGAIEALRHHGITVPQAAIRRGLGSTIWPGRCEVISRRPLIIVDGAQNAASSQVIRDTVAANFTYKKLILVLGISQDKDIPGICRKLGPLGDTIILTQADNPRAARVENIEKIIRRYVPRSRQIIKTQSVAQARRQALALAGKGDLVLVTGSLFVVGEFSYVAPRPK